MIKIDTTMNNLPRHALRLAAVSCLVALSAISLNPVWSQASTRDRPANTVSVDELRGKAKSGNAAAQYELARRHARGDGVPMDKALALKFYEASAAQGFALAEYELATYYGGASGEKFDPQQAFAFTRKAAEHGHGAAQVDLAFTYYNGNEKVPKDMELSFQWFKKAADSGVVVANCMLGDFYKNGLGAVKQDFAQAFKWYELGAGQQDKCAPKAQYELYVAYEAGKGVRKNLKTAMAWLVKAAEAGNPQAQRVLGQSYAKGYGVERDPELARMWLRKSREGVSWHEDHDEASRAGRHEDHAHHNDRDATAKPKIGHRH